MFRANTAHQQNELFGCQSALSDEKLEKLKSCEEWTFYWLIFRQIPEQEFAVLFSQKGSRPNAPVNTLVAALILKHRHGWSYEQLLGHIDFDMKTRAALGLWEFNETPFSEATIFNFGNRLADYQGRTGQNLLERVFDRLTSQQLQALELKTTIQRADSFLAASNIRDYSRLQLIIEVLGRFCRLLSKDECQQVEGLQRYLKQTSGQYLYQLAPGSTGEELERLGKLYQQLLLRFEADYGDTQAWGILKRVFTEHFTLCEQTVQVLSAEELTSDCLQSPDDPEATYRKKRTQQSKGQVIHVAETCHPENQLNLITDVAVAPNNTDDAAILAERADAMNEKTPDLKELHTDGGYGSDEAEQELSEHEIALIQTAIRGRKPAVRMDISQTKQGWQVSCPHQIVEAERTPKRWKAEFDKAVCAGCPFADQCPSQVGKTARRWYFAAEDAARQKRWERWEALPDERKKLRPNVEATVRQMQEAMRERKLTVRGTFGTHCYGLLRAIGVNLGRIARYLADPKVKKSLKTLAKAFFINFTYLLYKYYLYNCYFFRNLQFRHFQMRQISKFPA
jgi:hypothetical protein